MEYINATSKSWPWTPPPPTPPPAPVCPGGSLKACIGLCPDRICPRSVCGARAPSRRRTRAGFPGDSGRDRGPLCCGGGLGLLHAALSGSVAPCDRVGAPSASSGPRSCPCLDVLTKKTASSALAMHNCSHMYSTIDSSFTFTCNKIDAGAWCWRLPPYQVLQPPALSGYRLSVPSAARSQCTTRSSTRGAMVASSCLEEDAYWQGPSVSTMTASSISTHSSTPSTTAATRAL